MKFDFIWVETTYLFGQQVLEMRVLWRRRWRVTWLSLGWRQTVLCYLAVTWLMADRCYLAVTWLKVARRAYATVTWWVTAVFPHCWWNFRSFKNELVCAVASLAESSSLIGWADIVYKNRTRHQQCSKNWGGHDVLAPKRQFPKKHGCWVFWPIFPQLKLQMREP